MVAVRAHKLNDKLNWPWRMDWLTYRADKSQHWIH